MDGMDMDGIDGSTDPSMMVAMMKPWLHFTGGDTLFFNGLAPRSGGAIAGACIVLFILALLERGLSGMRAVMETRWRQRAMSAVATKLKLDDAPSDVDVKFPVTLERQNAIRSAGPANYRRIAPFIPKNDLARGLFQVAQALAQYTLMLAVMTFHAGYIMAIVVGLGVGETLFARLRTNSELEEGAHAH